MTFYKVFLLIVESSWTVLQSMLAIIIYGCLHNSISFKEKNKKQLIFSIHSKFINTVVLGRICIVNETYYRQGNIYYMNNECLKRIVYEQYRHNILLGPFYLIVVAIPKIISDIGYYTLHMQANRIPNL